MEDKIQLITKESKKGDDVVLRSCLKQAKKLCENFSRSPQPMVLLAGLLLKSNQTYKSIEACQKALVLMQEETIFDRKTVDKLLSFCRGAGIRFLNVHKDVFMYLLPQGKATEEDEAELRKQMVENCQFGYLKGFSETMHSYFPDNPLWLMCKITSMAYDKDLKDYSKRLNKLFKNLEKKTKNNTPFPEFFVLHFSMLERLDRSDHAFKLLSQYGDSIHTAENNESAERAIKYTKGRVLAANNKTFQEAANIFKDLFENSEIDKFPNNLQCFLHYISCLVKDGAVLLNMPLFAAIHPLEYNIHPLKYNIHPLKLAIRNRSDVPMKVFLEGMNSAINWVQSLEHPPSSDFSRFYYLAILEIETRKIKYGCGDSLFLAKLLLKSFQSCGHFLCFPFDVETFFLVLTDEEKKNLLRDFESCLVDNNDTDFLCKKTSIFKIQKLLGLTFDLPFNDLERDAINMTELFIRSLSMQELEFGQSMPGEDLPCLVCDLLVQLYCRSQHLSYLVQAVFVLEFGLKVKSGVSKYIILLVHLYSHLGAYLLAFKWFKELYFENKSMVFSQLLTSPFLKEAVDTLGDYTLEKDKYLKEMSKSINQLYIDNEVFKAAEDIHLFYRLERCHKYLMPDVELEILPLKCVTDISELAEVYLALPSAEFTPCDVIMDESTNNLTFQKAVESSPWWSPTPFINFLLDSPEKYSCINPIFGKPDLDKMKDMSVKTCNVTMKRRSLILLMLQRVASSISPSELYNLLHDYASCGGYSLKDVEQTIIQISAGDNKTLKDLQYYTLDVMNMAVFMNANKWDEPDTWSILDNFFTNIAKEKMTSILQFSRCPGEHTGFFVQMVSETFTWHIVIMKSLTAQKKELNTQLLLNSIESMCRILEDIKDYFKVDDNKWNLSNSGVEGSVTIPTNVPSFGDRITGAMGMSWKQTENVIKGSLRKTFSQVLELCESKVLLLDILKREVCCCKTEFDRLQ